MISSNGLVKKYDTLLAVDGLSLEIPKGELFGFIGPNGAGKTTTIKILVGLLKPSSGTVLIEGLDIRDDPIQVKKLSVIFLTDPLFIIN